MSILDINSAWEELRKRVDSCQKCELCRTRIRTVLGEGPTEKCRCVVVGEAPGEDEDKSGRPFVGKAGQLLTKIFTDSKIPREKLYITNILKCRPPKNRDPLPFEMEACKEHLEAQLLLLHPDIVVTLGRFSTQWLFANTKTSITNMRGKWFDWRGIQFFPMFHPSYLLHKGDIELLKLTYMDAHVLKNALEILRKRYKED